MIGSSAHNIARFCYHVKQKSKCSANFFLDIVVDRCYNAK
nr:MAG TPA: hypothetical protein [Caudoviricetes sp.]